jgi:hypothetical protein
MEVLILLILSVYINLNTAILKLISCLMVATEEEGTPDTHGTQVIHAIEGIEDEGPTIGGPITNALQTKTSRL